MMKLKRILSWIIDWNLSGLPALIYAAIFAARVRTHGTSTVGLLLFLLFVLSFPTIFVLRDVIFGGRSLAKRMFRLRVVSAGTGEAPSAKDLILRNVFFFIYPIDAILLIATNKSLGDTVTNTTVEALRVE